MKTLLRIRKKLIINKIYPILLDPFPRLAFDEVNLDFYDKEGNSKLNNSPIFKKVTPDEVDKESDQTILKIKDVLDTKIRPAVARDGGDIKFKSFENGIVLVELQGSCSGCPSSLMTLKQGVQNLLCHYVKEVKSVKAL